jgi:hypothetical protein
MQLSGNMVASLVPGSMLHRDVTNTEADIGTVPWSCVRDHAWIVDEDEMRLAGEREELVRNSDDDLIAQLLWQEGVSAFHTYN